MSRAGWAAVYVLSFAAGFAALGAFQSMSNTHPEPDSAVMEPSADGSHWVTPRGTRVYLLHAAGMVCAVAEGQGARSVAASCVPAVEETP